jgi:hypothetical protein
VWAMCWQLGPERATASAVTPRLTHHSPSHAPSPSVSPRRRGSVPARWAGRDAATQLAPCCGPLKQCPRHGGVCVFAARIHRVWSSNSNRCQVGTSYVMCHGRWDAPRPVTGRAAALPASTHAPQLRTPAASASTSTPAWMGVGKSQDAAAPEPPLLVNRLHHQAPNRLFASSSTPLPAWALPSHSCDTAPAPTEATSLHHVHDVHHVHDPHYLDHPSEPLKLLEPLQPRRTVASMRTLMVPQSLKRPVWCHSVQLCCSGHTLVAWINVSSKMHRSK